ncbi:DNA primase [Texas Phoenix palm phytoplasma]|uniref:DNA primase n=1 Tax=Texas Phoenix palm phytoplasma TaxID=176709 RepID=A0ABS5BHX8_9MOLU|nr:DNA primase [Texas Phoenix palm phytoplasma]MBP3059188.1 DNA primase [Texas Phoenix palm phytoplasma]
MNKNNKYNQFVTEVNKKILIYELVNKEGIKLTKKGKNFMGLCPFHKEKTPSFSVSPELNIAFCMSCHQGGKPVTFYHKLKNISISQAIEELAKKFNLLLPNNFINPNDYFYQILQDAHKYYMNKLDFILLKCENHPLQNYLLKERKLNYSLIKEFQLGYAEGKSNDLMNYLLEKNYSLKELKRLGLIRNKNIDFQKNNDSELFFDEVKEKYCDFFKNRLIFPLSDSQGRIVAFSGRLINLSENNSPKYLFNSETFLFKKSDLIYRIFEHKNNIQKKKEIILCEGFLDVISLFKIGKCNALAILGTQLTLKQIFLLKKLSVFNVLVAFDSDQAGQSSMQKISLALIKQKFKVKILFLPEGQDPDSYINMNINIKNYDDYYDLLLSEITQDYILYKIYELRKNKISDEKIKMNVLSLLKFYDNELQLYYVKKIYNKYKIYIDLEKNTISFEELNFKISNKKSQNIFSSRMSESKITKENLILIEQRKIQNKNINKNLIHILTNLFLSKEYLNFVRTDILQYNIDSYILEFIDIIQKYYDSKLNFDKKDDGINIDHFFEIYKDILYKLNNKIDIFQLLLDIKKNILFIQKGKIKNQEDLKTFYNSLKINHNIQKIKKIKKNIEKMEKKFFQAINENEKKTLLREWKFKTQELKNIELENKKFLEYIRFNVFNDNFNE